VLTKEYVEQFEVWILFHHRVLSWNPSAAD